MAIIQSRHVIWLNVILLYAATFYRKAICKTVLVSDKIFIFDGGQVHPSPTKKWNSRYAHLF